ncbi:MAG: hypothetical protein TR69_WS6001000748 [candidate division WS6 bacterium OLB20]|uniref:Uncharacterized protein n=1 Tax=candidate division WS6 bacterium OLB20 TaxID=1617426 RepID=A0A136LYL1_9BACT|nr:MAG: hypothetical protein TR69_WS6001000748 [candidate division WS6 bacterium OLB20]
MEQLLTYCLQAEKSPTHPDTPNALRQVDDERADKIKSSVDTRRNEIADRAVAGIVDGTYADVNAAVGALANGNDVIERKIRERFALHTAREDARNTVNAYVPGNNAQVTINNLINNAQLPDTERDSLISQVRQREMQNLRDLVTRGAITPAQLDATLQMLPGVSAGEAEQLRNDLDAKGNAIMKAAREAIANGDTDANVLMLANGNPELTNRINVLIAGRAEGQQANRNLQDYRTNAQNAATTIQNIQGLTTIPDTERARMIAEVRAEETGRIEDAVGRGSMDLAGAQAALNALGTVDPVTRDRIEGRARNLAVTRIEDAVARGAMDLATAQAQLNALGPIDPAIRDRIEAAIRGRTTNEVNRTIDELNNGSINGAAALARFTPGSPEHTRIQAVVDRQRAIEDGNNEYQLFIGGQDAATTIQNIDTNANIPQTEKDNLISKVRERALSGLEDRANRGEITRDQADAEMATLQGVDGARRTRILNAAGENTTRIVDQLSKGLEDGTIDEATARARVTALGNANAQQRIEQILERRQGDTIAEGYFNNPAGNAGAALGALGALLNLAPGDRDRIRNRILEEEVKRLRRRNLNEPQIRAAIAGLGLDADTQNQLLAEGRIIQQAEGLINATAPLDANAIIARLGGQAAFNHLPQEVRDQIAVRIQTEHGAHAQRIRLDEDNARRAQSERKLRNERRREARERFMAEVYNARKWLMSGVVGGLVLASGPLIPITAPIAIILRIRHHHNMTEKAESMLEAADQRNVDIAKIRREYMAIAADRAKAELQRYAAMAKGLQDIMIQGARPPLTDEQQQRMAEQIQYALGNIDKLQQLFDMTGRTNNNNVGGI